MAEGGAAILTNRARGIQGGDDLLHVRYDTAWVFRDPCVIPYTMPSPNHRSGGSTAIRSTRCTRTCHAGAASFAKIAEDVTQETSLRAAEPGHATEYRAELSRRCHHQGGAHRRTDVGRAGEVGLRGHRVQAHAAEFARRRLRRFAASCPAAAATAERQRVSDVSADSGERSPRPDVSGAARRPSSLRPPTTSSRRRECRL